MMTYQGLQDWNDTWEAVILLPPRMLAGCYSWPHMQLHSFKQVNRLEKDVQTDLPLLKVDGLLFDQIYADLMCILKSKIDMNTHYWELLQHLK